MLVYLDGMDLQDVQEVSIKDFLLRFGLHTKSKIGKASKVSFCGFIPVYDDFAVFFPKTFRNDYPQEESMALARVLYKSLKKYSRLAKQDKQFINLGDVSQVEDDLSSLGYMAALADILEDWIAYGPYKSKQYKFVRSYAGKIDWKKTAKQIVPNINSAGVAVFPSFVTRKRDYHSDDMIAQLQKWAVANADFHLGWLYSDNKHGVLFPDLARYRDKPPCEVSYAVTFLRKSLKTHFDQRKIRLINFLIRFLEGKASSTQGQYKMGVKFFWPVWEQVCGDIFENQSDQHFSSLPQPEYTSSRELPLDYGVGISQKPDIMSTNDNSMSILDAKYYDMSETQPGWSDIVKQLYYADIAGDTGQWGGVSNAFIFPRPINDKIAERVVVKSVDGSPSRYSPIHCIYLDMSHALKVFIGDEELNEEFQKQVKFLSLLQ